MCWPTSPSRWRQSRERNEWRRDTHRILANYDAKLAAFVDFVLAQYVAQGESAFEAGHDISEMKCPVDSGFR